MRNFIENRLDRYQDVPHNLTTDTCQEKIDAILDDPAGYKVTNEYNHGDVRSKLRLHFGIKCVYCEASPIATSTFRIDHYRPKKNIKNETHTGYYWLAYEWSNLMQTCQFCNGEKSNHFPLKAHSIRIDENTANALNEANRRPDIAPLNTEQRLLLHPEIDEVENHFTFTFDGEIQGLTEEGIKSIEHYGLKRDDLIASRKTIRDEYLDDLKGMLKEYEVQVANNEDAAKIALYSSLKLMFMKILGKYKLKCPFSLFHFFMFDSFDAFFINHLPIDEHKGLVQFAYQQFKDGQL